jgi:putative Mg2+ transporter-C (MgtC) family protein
MELTQFFQSINQVMHPVLAQLGLILAAVFGTLDPVFIGRLLLVLLLCGLIGLERSEHERASGFRPHILVGLGACLMAMAGAYAVFPGAQRDPLRVASYVVSGVGFLGAGAILRHGTTVRGLTTAASLWGAAGIGITVAAGLGWLAVSATVLILFTLVGLEKLEFRLGRGETASDLKLYLSDDHRAVGKALTALDRLGVPLKKATLLPAEGDTAIMRVELNRSLRADQMQRIVERLLTVKSILRVDIAALEVEDVEALTEQAGILRSSIDAQMEELNLNDENLLQDLNEPEGNSPHTTTYGRR